MSDYASRIEHTTLGPLTQWDDVVSVLDTAEKTNMRVCIPPRYVSEASFRYPCLNISTVVGFPNGQHMPDIKEEEAQLCMESGADEIDVVANIANIKAKDSGVIQSEVNKIVESVSIPVKVIIESHLLSQKEIQVACEAIKQTNAAFVKTSTGFTSGGATVSDVQQMSQYLPVKASGGINTKDKAIAMFEAGAERIGTSSGNTIVREL